ncbi:MAG: alpha/beta hydrolase, partial [Candidatus Binatia bacterium]
MTPYATLQSAADRRLPPGPSRRLWFEIGRFVDEGSLLYEAWRLGRADESALRRRAARYQAAVEVLEARGLLAEPSPLFPAPRELPPIERKAMRIAGVSAFDSIRYASNPVSVFPASMATAARDPGGRNRLAYAYLWRHGDRGRRTIVCIHGYRGGFAALDGRAFEVQRLFLEAGLDVALAILPYHGPRTPDGSVSGQPFLNDPRRTLEAVAQGIHDLRVLVSWLRHDGAGPVGVAGFSLGGYMTALLASVEPGLAFAAPIIPVASFADLLWERSGRRGEHEAARAAGMSLELFRKLFTPHCPLDHRPLVDRERRLVIAGEADRIAPPEHAAALAAHWQTEVEWFPGGHLAQLGR